MKLLLRLFIILIAFANNAVLANKSAVIERLSSIAPNLSEQDIYNSHIDGVYEVIIREPLTIIYITEDGRYLLQGELFDLVKGRAITRQRIAYLTGVLIDAISDEDKIIFAAEDEKYHINVFTDVDCPYCVKFHSEIDKMNSLGITVKYLASPLESLHPNAFGIMEKIWCSDDKVKAFDDYKTKKIIPIAQDCENPVAEQLAIAENIGVTGTPVIFLSNGLRAPGYVPPDELFEALQQVKALQ